MDDAFNPKEWISSKEAAELSGYSRSAILAATSRGNLKSIKIGNMRFYKRENVIEYMHQMQNLGSQRHTRKAYRTSKS